MDDKNEPQEYREIERDARSLSAQVSADMLKYPRARWFLAPIRNALKWVETQCDRALKDDGWR